MALSAACRRLRPVPRDTLAASISSVSVEDDIAARDRDLVLRVVRISSCSSRSSSTSFFRPRVFTSRRLRVSIRLRVTGTDKEEEEEVEGENDPSSVSLPRDIRNESSSDSDAEVCDALDRVRGIESATPNFQLF